MTVADETLRPDRRASLVWRWAGVAVLLVLLGAHLIVLNMDATATSRLIPVARLFDLAFLAFTLILSHAAGRRVLALLGLTTSPTESVAFATALGLGIGAYASLSLGLVGLYRPPVLIAGIAIATLVLRREIVADVAGLTEFGDRVRHAQPRVVRRPLVAFVMMAAVIVASVLLILNLPGSYGPLPDFAGWLSDLLVEIEMPRFAGIIWYNVGLLNEWLYRLVLVLATAALAAIGSFAWRSGRHVRPAVVALVAVLGSSFVLTIFGALTPPHHWDALTYHLAAPEYFLETGWIRPVPQIEWSNLPMTAELLYGVGLAFGSESFSQLLHAAFGGITALALWGFAQRRVDRLTAWLALAIFVATPQVQMWARIANIDLALACFIFLATIAALHAGDAAGDVAGSRPWLTVNRRWLVLAGAFAGLALGSKYQAAAAIAPLGLLVLVDSWRRYRFGDRLTRHITGDALAFGGTAALVALPWYLKNLILLHNPVWPLVIGGKDISDSTLELMNYYAASMILSPRTIEGYLMLPMRAYEIGDYELSPGVIPSPLFVLVPLALFVPLARRLRREFAYLLLVSAGFTAGWALGFQELRYLLPVCAPLSFVVAILLRDAWNRGRLRPVVHVALLGTALFSLLFIGFLTHWEGPPGVVLGSVSRDSYMNANASYRAIHVLEARMQPGETAMYMHEAQVYYSMSLIDSVRTDHLGVNMIELMEAHPEPEDALAALKTQGIDYLLVNEGSIRFWLRFDEDERLVHARERFDDLIPLLDQVHREGIEDRTDIVIYRVP
jgi:4-amino-4-deoxy-L-arabinose transferase-like glycosyltransferase